MKGKNSQRFDPISLGYVSFSFPLTHLVKSCLPCLDNASGGSQSEEYLHLRNFDQVSCNEVAVPKTNSPARGSISSARAIMRGDGGHVLFICLLFIISLSFCGIAL